MSRLVLPIALALLLPAAVGCGTSHDTADDAGITFDATLPDSGRDGAMMPLTDGRMPSCGDGILDTGEQCDDHNNTDGDGCDATCHFESYCGDGTTDSDEVCDDHNNRSGDGCRSDCQSDETCGNGIRDIAAGEACDDGNTIAEDGCSADCQRVESCGNGTVDAAASETCDDGPDQDPPAPWDGCGIDCRDEISLIINSMRFGQPNQGCDYSGDGVPDNRLAQALGGARAFLNGFLQGGIAEGQAILLMSMMGMEDATGADDDSLRVAWLQGQDGDDDPMNNFSGNAEFLVTESSLELDGAPITSFESRIASHMLVGGPEDIEIPGVFILPIELKRGRVVGTTVAAAGKLSSIEEGTICGIMPATSLAILPDPASFLGGTPLPACGTSGEAPNMADMLLGGATLLGFTIGSTMPDVDVDGDGLERYEIEDGGAPDCQAIVSACIDGDGTRIEGHSCVFDGRMADGFSAGLPFTAVGARIVGVTTDMSGGGSTPPPRP